MKVIIKQQIIAIEYLFIFCYNILTTVAEVVFPVTLYSFIWKQP